MQIAESLLQGATPLHCGALRGNPAQVDHLVYCSADATLPSAAGLLPVQLVPLCGDRDKARNRICRCLTAHDEAVWDCRSRGTRDILLQSMLTAFSVGVHRWLHHALQVCRCWLGVWGMSKTLMLSLIHI